MVADFTNGVYGSADTFKLSWQMAQGLAQSTIVPKEYQKNPANCLVAISQAQKFNIDPFTVMNNAYMIQGKFSWKSSFLIAMINASKKYDMELQFEETNDKDGNPYSCRCWTTLNGRRVDGITVTMDMAKAEGWTSKNGSKWKTLPALMMRYRSASFFANLNCPELTSGLYTQEEILDNDFKEYKEDKASLNDLLMDDDEVLKGEVID